MEFLDLAADVIITRKRKFLSGRDLTKQKCRNLARSCKYRNVNVTVKKTTESGVMGGFKVQNIGNVNKEIAVHASLSTESGKRKRSHVEIVNTKVNSESESKSLSKTKAQNKKMKTAEFMTPIIESSKLSSTVTTNKQGRGNPKTKNASPAGKNDNLKLKPETADRALESCKQGVSNVQKPLSAFEYLQKRKTRSNTKSTGQINSKIATPDSKASQKRGAKTPQNVSLSQRHKQEIRKKSINPSSKKNVKKTDNILGNTLPAIIEEIAGDLNDQQYTYLKNHYKKYITNKEKEWKDKHEKGDLTISWVKYKLRSVRKYKLPDDWIRIREQLWKDSKITETLNYQDEMGKDSERAHLIRDSSWSNIIKEKRRSMRSDGQGLEQPKGKINAKKEKAPASSVNLGKVDKVKKVGKVSPQKKDNTVLTEKISKIPISDDVKKIENEETNTIVIDDESPDHQADDLVDSMIIDEDVKEPNDVRIVSVDDLSDAKDARIISIGELEIENHAEGAEDVTIDDDDDQVGSTFIRAYTVNEGVLVLTDAVQLYVKGFATLHISWGQCSILGYKMAIHEQSENLYSPNCHSHLTIQVAENPTKFTRSDVTSILKDFPCTRSITWHDDFAKTSAVLFFSWPERDFVIEYLDEQWRYNGLFSFDHTNDSVNELMKTQGINLELSTRKMEDSHSVVTSEFDEVLAKWNEVLTLNKQESASVMVCGGKNSGKSTLSRFLINSTLGTHDSVCYLDCDVGQTEFSPPGCISLHVIKDPVLGPPFTHQLKSDHVCYYGAVTPGNDPDFYIECVRTVFDLYLTLEPRPPLIINTLGWIKGLGFRLLMDIFHITHPHVVAQLVCASPGDNLRDLVPAHVTESHGWLYNTDYGEGLEGDAALEFTHDVVIVKSMVDADDCTYIDSSTLRPRDYRDMATLANLVPALGQGLHTSFLGVAPHKVTWSHVAIHVTYDQIESCHLLTAINGGVVALCETDLSKAEHIDGDPDMPYVFESTPLNSFIGLGIVRGIDMEERQIYITTSLSTDEMARVNTLIKAVDHLPDSIATLPPFTNTPLHLPYTGQVVDTPGAFTIESAVAPRLHFQLK